MKQSTANLAGAPLAGLKVLDFSTLLPGPFATLMLADLGAEVIHVESPTRVDLVRVMPPYADGQATAHAYLNRNKKSLAVDLKQADNIEKIKALLNEFDIIVEQFRPGVMQRLGLGYDDLKAINPRLIYCSITGYGQTGSHKDRAGHDINYMSLAGVAGHSGRKHSGPPALGIQVADVAGGSLHAVIGILAAVIERNHSNQGQHIDISMTDCVFTLNNMAASAQIAGGENQAPEAATLNGGSYYDYFKTSDGRYISVGSLEPQFMMGLSAALALPVLAQKGASMFEEDRREVKQAVADAIAAQSFSHWQQVFAKLDVCVEPVLSLKEAAESQLAKERGWVVPVPLKEGDTNTTQPQLACPIKFSRSSARYEYVGQQLGEANDKLGEV
ncbi:CaiB/BaiF CoA transferase family protein [Alkanindiges sp. WGS2144]|uniref:CaiB/BaiF CoA transferase family protein n=1 Tax=Alkanindiges sp. WGS2144 TaxID=3366808 RepID=UPI003751C3D2